MPGSAEEDVLLIHISKAHSGQNEKTFLSLNIVMNISLFISTNNPDEIRPSSSLVQIRSDL